jgi:hypothetical protein
VSRRSLSVLLACVGVALPLRGQSEEPPGAPVDVAARAQKAIDDFKNLPADAKGAQRRRALVWLGEIDHELATEFLRGELIAAADTGFAATVIEAIGKVARPALQPELTAVLQRASAPMAARIAAAGAIARLGNGPMDALLAMVAADDKAVPKAQRDAVVAGLLAGRNERAMGALATLLPGLPAPGRLDLLRRFDGVRGVAGLDAARVNLVLDARGDLETAATAWRQLAEAKHERAKALTVDVLERVVGEPREAIAAQLVRGLVRVGDADFYPSLLRHAAVPGEAVRQAVRDSAGAAAEDPALIKWLVTVALDNPDINAREIAKLLLRSAPVEAVQPLVERVRADLRAGKKKALDLAAGLHELLAKDPSWRQDLAVLAAAKDDEHRMLGLSMLLEIGADAGIETAQKSLKDTAWELRSLCYRYLTKCRDVSSIPLLIARYGKEEGRLAAELEHALFVHTATRCFSKKEWDGWWAKHKNGFALPHADTVKGGGSSSGGNTIAYHDIPVVSTRIAFLVDRSGSMREKVGTDKKRTRLDVAKEQLTRVVEALPATHHVNLIAYETGVDPLWNEIRKLDPDNRQKLLEIARLLPLGGGTNIFDAIEKAFADPNVDTIYLMTDGQPSAGRLRTTEDIVDEVQRWNRTRQIVIHCISIGLDSDLLKRLAAMSGGAYRYVR